MRKSLDVKNIVFFQFIYYTLLFFIEIKNDKKKYAKLILQLLSRGGDILVAPSSWQWANPNEYIHENLPDGVHTLIIACSTMWYQSKTQDIQTDIEDGT